MNTDLDTPIYKGDAFPHYSNSRFQKEQTIFGTEDSHLHYDYSDRLVQWDYTKSKLAQEIADEKVKVKNPETYTSARWFQEYLTAYFDKPVILKHIIAGVNRSNGYDYRVYGYEFANVIED